MADDRERRPVPRARRSTDSTTPKADPLMAALGAAVMRNRRMFESAFDALLVVDAEGRCVELNPAAEALFGWLADDAEGRLVERMIVPPEYRAQHRLGFGRAAAEGHVPADAPRRLTAMHRDGHTFPIELRVLRTEDGGQVQFVGVARPAQAPGDVLDETAIPDRRRAEATFVASLSHDIRTPLSAITTLSDLVASEDDVGAIKRYVDRIDANAQVLRRLVGDLLDVAMLDVRHLAVEPQTVDLVDLLHTAADSARGRLTGDAVELRTRLGPDLPPQIITDPRRLLQVLGNLLNNAAKMTDVGRIELAAECRNELGGRAQVRIRVSDTGPGIPPEMARRLFERFGTASSGVWAERAGSGLGLSICKALVQLIGGRLDFETEVGRGTTFFIDLDVEVVDQFGDDSTTAMVVPRLFAPEHGWMLIADDSADNRFALGESMRRRGWTVQLAASGREAIDKAMAGRPDVVLMDVEMGDLDGIEATRRIRRIERRRKEPARPIFALTGHATAEMRARCLDAGMNGFYTKPFDLDRLHADLWQLLNAEVSPTGDRPPDMDATLPVSDADGLDENVRRHLPGYFANRRQDVQRLRALADAADLAGIGRVTHRLRGTCGLFGMPSLVAMAHHVEQLVDARDIVGIHAAIDAFDVELDRLEEILLDG